MVNGISIILLPVSILLLIITSSTLADPAFAQSDPGTVLGIYMIGSDLEYDPDLSNEENSIRKGLATKDIREMISGWGEGTDTLEVLVAYGGSQKDGWRGMTLATIDMLKSDDKDGIIGNSDQDFLERKDTEMVSKEALTEFLTYLHDTYPGSRKMVILWDHGSAYYGFGKDTAREERISAQELGDSFSETGDRYHLIGFDACFMADLEVITLVSPCGDYYLASEETEPEHGWDYHAGISSLVEDPDIDPKTFGIRIIDSYLENPEHQKGALALSLIDLNKTRRVLSSLQKFASKLQVISQDQIQYPQLSRCIGTLHGLGTVKDADGEDVDLMVDLVSLVKGAEDTIGPMDESEMLTSALNDLIVYEKHDTPTSQMHGIGIFPPVMSSHPSVQESIKSGTVLDVTDAWILFLRSFSEHLSEDDTAPELIRTKDGYYVNEDGYVLITDLFVQNRSDKSQIILGQEPSAVDKQNKVTPPEWNGGTTFLDDGSSSSLLPVYYVETTGDGIQLYYAWGYLGQGEPRKYTRIRMDIWYNPDVSGLTWRIRPYTILSDGKQEFERSTTLYPGDEIIVFSVIQNPDGTRGWEEVGKVFWSDQMEIIHKELPCGDYGVQVVATDLAGNTGYSEIIPYEKPCTDHNSG